MNFATAPRRPSRAAVALLALLHLAAIEALVHLKTTPAPSTDRLVTLLLSTLAPPTRPTPPLPSAAPLARAPRPLLAPLPPVVVAPAAPTPEGAAPIAAVAAPRSAGLAADGAASMPGPATLDLTIPKDFYAHPPPLTPAQEAMQDPRSNRLVLTKQEKMDVDFGVVECIAWQREPDGRIYRGPGHWQRIRSVGTNPFSSHRPGSEDRGMECVK